MPVPGSIANSGKYKADICNVCFLTGTSVNAYFTFIQRKALNVPKQFTGASNIRRQDAPTKLPYLSQCRRNCPARLPVKSQLAGTVEARRSFVKAESVPQFASDRVLLPCCWPRDHELQQGGPPRYPLLLQGQPQALTDGALARYAPPPPKAAVRVTVRRQKKG
ncbi:hypothetical protein NDU88_010181 [Pleurodeles waltl]|uniref:Uncharacterized protein n=1 Tax=Pleurodeles waltl TaxID=8319 RepID=A0AAV7PV67_PLEWA|nr:hypothetical protein NDU88_010181 [Pleurodeles waltl]